LTSDAILPQLDHSYLTVDEVEMASEIIVVGVFEDKEHILKQGLSQKPVEPGHRDLMFHVTDTIKGKTETDIWVAQRVAFNSNGTVAGPIEGDTLFISGNKYVLFLNLAISSTRQGYDFYWVTGATQGAFLVVDDKVYSRNNIGEIPEEIGPTVQSVPLEQFIADLKEKAS